MKRVVRKVKITVNRKLSVLVALIAAVVSWGASVSYPFTPVPTARFATALSYDMYGIGLYKSNVAGASAMIHGFNASFTYSPITFINFGLDVGERKVDIFTYDKSYNFDGKIGFAGGTHVKLATPYFSDIIGIVGVARTLWFSSARHDVYYGGMDFTGAGGISFHINSFGYISCGMKYFEIFGRTGGVQSPIGSNWSNDKVSGGFVSFDMFPKTSARKYIPFVSVELALFPQLEAFDGDRPAIRNASLSITIGGITNRLYGNSDNDWRP